MERNIITNYKRRKTKTKRFKRYCIKCDNLFRPHGRTSKICEDCADKLGYQRVKTRILNEQKKRNLK